MEFDIPLFRELVGNIGVVLFAAGVLDGLWLKGSILEGLILMTTGAALICLSTIHLKSKT